MFILIQRLLLIVVISIESRNTCDVKQHMNVSYNEHTSIYILLIRVM